MEIQVDQHFSNVTLRLMVRVKYWIDGDMKKEGFVAGKLIIVGRITYREILHAVVLRVAKRLSKSPRNWYDYGVVWMVGSCQWDAILLAVI